MKARRVVVDTNTLISALLTQGTPRRVMQAIFDQEIEILLSERTYDELVTRLERPKFDRYRGREAWAIFLAELVELATWIEDTAIEAVSRDRDDDKFLALAIAGEADTIISGDQDLLVLEVYESIPILTAAAFLNSLR